MNPRWQARLLWLSCVLLFSTLCGVGGDLRAAASSGPFRLQTDAWLAGASSSQPWGLGVPLLRLPFEAVARLVGANGFPDRLVLVGLFALVIAVLWRALDGLSAPVRGAAIGLTALSPAFVTLVRTSLAAAAEAQAFAYLWALLLLALLLRVRAQVTTPRLVALAAAAGLGLFISPGLMTAALVTLALGAIESRREPRAVLSACALFVALAGTVAWTNQARFGDPLESGQRLSLPALPAEHFARHFGHPYATEPLTSASLELFSALFLSGERFSSPAFSSAVVLPFQSQTPRLREFFASTFRIDAALLLLAGWFVAARFESRDRRAHLTALWSVAVFTLDFLITARSPTLTTLEVLRLGPAIAAGALALVLFTASALETRFGDHTTVAAATIAWLLLEVSRAAIAPNHAARPMFRPSQLVRGVAVDPPAAAEVRCGAATTPVLGWDVSGRCGVDVATALHLRPSPCVRLTVATRGGDTAFEHVRVDAGLTRLEPKDQHTFGVETTLTFCAPPSPRPQATGRALISIGWVSPEALGDPPPPLRLSAVEAIDAP